MKNLGLTLSNQEKHAKAEEIYEGDTIHSSPEQ